MFKDETVLLLGAGSSIPFGLPTGDDLRKSIGKSVSGFLAQEQQQHGGAIVRGQKSAEFIQSPIRFLYENVQNRGASASLMSLEKLSQFVNALNQSTQTTIDRFLHDNAEFRELGKILITAMLLRSVYKNAPYKDLIQLNDFSSPPSINWVSTLVNLIREGARDADHLEDDNNLTIITFNYDTILEHILNEHLCANQRHKGGNIKKICPVHHVHGKVEMPRIIEGDFILEHILKEAQSFYLIREASPDQPFIRFKESAHDTAQRILSSAERIHAMGFSFDEYNTAAIGLDVFSWPDQIFALNYNGHHGVTRRLNKMGVPTTNIISGSQQEAYDCKTALEQGFLE